MESSLQVRERGTLALPSRLRAKYRIKTGDRLQLVDLDGIFVLTPRNLTVAELAQEIEGARIQAKVSTKQMLKALRRQRKLYYKEKYAR